MTQFGFLPVASCFFSFIFSIFGHGELMRVSTLSAWDVDCWLISGGSRRIGRATGRDKSVACGLRGVDKWYTVGFRKFSERDCI